MQAAGNFLKTLVDIECIQFGTFKLKSGIQSPVYIDLRNIVSYPDLLSDLSKLFVEHLPENTERLCGVPYAALPMATALSLQSGLPMLIKRKEAKGYGTKKMIEGKYTMGDKVVLIEDVITSGASLVETIAELEAEGLVISKILVVLDRQQGGVEKLQSKGYDVHALFSMDKLMQLLYDEKKVEKTIYDSVIQFLQEAKQPKFIEPLPIKCLPKKHPHPTAQRLLDIAHAKQSNIIASVDLTTTKEILDFLQAVGKNICAVKLHIDIVSDFTLGFIDELQTLAKALNFLIIEDRKFADIGNTQLLQLSEGIHKIASWADMVTIHLIAGEAALKAIEEWDRNNKPALIPIIEMSSAGALTDEHYINQCKIFLNKYSCVIGAVCQNTKLDNNLLKFTPGIHLSSTKDQKGQQFNTPQYAIETLQSDFLIVGRGLYLAEHPEQALQQYLNAVQSSNLFN